MCTIKNRIRLFSKDFQRFQPISRQLLTLPLDKRWRLYLPVHYWKSEPKNSRTDESSNDLKIMYMAASFPLIRPESRQPRVMAGLMWQPEMFPMV